jgi:transcriptional regulator of met regulon
MLKCGSMQSICTFTVSLQVQVLEILHDSQVRRLSERVAAVEKLANLRNAPMLAS